MGPPEKRRKLIHRAPERQVRSGAFASSKARSAGRKLCKAFAGKELIKWNCTPE